MCSAAAIPLACSGTRLNDTAQAAGAGGEASGGADALGVRREKELGGASAVGGSGATARGGEAGLDVSTEPGLTGAAGAEVGGSAGAYDGHGFVVHEWGTDTVVVGSDGSLQRGLHHEEEDLPPFVYHRGKAGTLLGALGNPSVTIKMETPVTYFYSDQPLTARASVSFPEGVLTQWYPGVSQFTPPIAAPDSVLPGKPTVYADPLFDRAFPFQTELCRKNHTALTGGELIWGEFAILAPDSDVTASLPEAPLAKFGWSYARAVRANPLQMANGETERFLFYRGLGQFDLPVRVRSLAAGKVQLENRYSEAMGQVFVLNVDAERGAFVQHASGIAPGAMLSDSAPSLEGAPALDAYVAQLGAAVTRALDGSGLFHDEATAMVNTWKRQWFRTPGIRILYLMPQTWTDRSIPLLIDPKPATLRRVMLIRVEVITPEQEANDSQALALFDTDEKAARAHFTALGRFAEPRLRRALALAPHASAASYLETIRTAESSVASGE